jgi:hypothetical protein
MFYPLARRRFLAAKLRVTLASTGLVSYSNSSLSSSTLGPVPESTGVKRKRQIYVIHASEVCRCTFKEVTLVTENYFRAPLQTHLRTSA